MQAARAYLEPTLGPTTPGRFGSPIHFNYYGYLIFQPHEHLIKKLRPEAKQEERDA